MKITFTVANANQPDGWQEDYETRDGDTGTPAEIIGRLIDNFNATLRPNEKPRQVLEIISTDGAPAKAAGFEHRWEKKNLVTINDKHGMYDKMQCCACGAVGKRHGLSPNVTLDAKFAKLKSCPGYDL